MWTTETGKIIIRKECGGGGGGIIFIELCVYFHLLLIKWLDNCSASIRGLVVDITQIKP